MGCERIPCITGQEPTAGFSSFPHFPQGAWGRCSVVHVLVQVIDKYLGDGFLFCSGQSVACCPVVSGMGWSLSKSPGVVNCFCQFAPQTIIRIIMRKRMDSAPTSSTRPLQGSVAAVVPPQKGISILQVNELVFSWLVITSRLQCDAGSDGHVRADTSL